MAVDRELEIDVRPTAVLGVEICSKEPPRRGKLRVELEVVDEE